MPLWLLNHSDDVLSPPQADLSPEAIERAQLEELQLEKEVIEPTDVDLRRDGRSALASAEAFARAAAMDIAAAPRCEASVRDSSVFGFGGAGVRGTSVVAIGVVDELSTLIARNGADVALWTVPMLKTGLRCVCGLLTGKKADLVIRLSSSSLFMEKQSAAAASAAVTVATEVIASDDLAER